MNRSLEITHLLTRLRAGDPLAEEDLIAVVYNELRSMANFRMGREARCQTLQATALVHEVWARLLRSSQVWDNRRHFFCAAAEAMRRILIENARRKLRFKRGGPQAKRFEVRDSDLVEHPIEVELIDLEEALRQFELNEPLKAQVVKLRFFVGLSNKEIADRLSLSLATVERYWKFSRAWLFQCMNS